MTRDELATTVQTSLRDFLPRQLHVCAACQILGGEQMRDGTRVTRKYDPMRGGIIIAASRRAYGKPGRLARAVILEGEWLYDTAGDIPIAEQLAAPEVMAEIERITALVVASLPAAAIIDAGDVVTIESSYELRMKG